MQRGKNIFLVFEFQNLGSTGVPLGGEGFCVCNGGARRGFSPLSLTEQRRQKESFRQEVGAVESACLSPKMPKVVCAVRPQLREKK